MSDEVRIDWNPGVGLAATRHLGVSADGLVTLTARPGREDDEDFRGERVGYLRAIHPPEGCEAEHEALLDAWDRMDGIDDGQAR